MSDLDFLFGGEPIQQVVELLLSSLFSLLQLALDSIHEEFKLCNIILILVAVDDGSKMVISLFVARQTEDQLLVGRFLAVDSLIGHLGPRCRRPVGFSIIIIDQMLVSFVLTAGTSRHSALRRQHISVYTLLEIVSCLIARLAVSFLIVVFLAVRLLAAALHV